MAAPAGAPRVHAENHQHLPVDLERWAALARAVLHDEGVAGDAEMALYFVDEARIEQLHVEHMGEAGATDVLSFPIDGAGAPEHGVDVPRLIGDVVICPPVAARNAARHPGTHAPVHRGTVDDELALLVVHGVLHLLGYDHATRPEREAMQLRERDLLARHHRGAVA